ncbi:hypothetical protein Trydic_g11022 [Trypoxylus dichotomus]
MQTKQDQPLLGASSFWNVKWAASSHADKRWRFYEKIILAVESEQIEEILWFKEKRSRLYAPIKNTVLKDRDVFLEETNETDQNFPVSNNLPDQDYILDEIIKLRTSSKIARNSKWVFNTKRDALGEIYYNSMRYLFVLAVKYDFDVDQATTS